MFDMMMSNVKHLKGRTQEGYTATVKCGEKAVNVVFNCLTRRLVIHKWYKLASDECDAVEKYATDYFLAMMPGEAIALSYER